MKINNLIVKIFLCIYLVIIITGVVIFENIGFGGGGLEKNIHTASNSETQPVTVKDISSETVSKTTPAVTVKETASSQDVTKQESTVVTETQTETVESETSCESSEPETVQTEVQNTQPETAAQPSYTFANGRITNTSALKSYRVTGASYVNMHKDKTAATPLQLCQEGLPVLYHLLVLITPLLIIMVQAVMYTIHTLKCIRIKTIQS